MTEEKEVEQIAKIVAREAAEKAAEKFAANELLTRIDERVKHIQIVDMSEIKKHLETLNSHVADNSERSISNKSQVRNLWMIIIAHMALLGTIIGLIIHYAGS